MYLKQFGENWNIFSKPIQGKKPFVIIGVSAMIVDNRLIPKIKR